MYLAHDFYGTSIIELCLLHSVLKKNKNVLMMSSFHTKNEISETREDKKPAVILDYNKGKGGVDIMDSCVEDFSCKRKTNRYPLVYFFNMIDIAANNAYIIMKSNGYNKSRYRFLKMLSEQLAQENMQHRYDSEKSYSQSKNAFHAFGFSVKSNPHGVAHVSGSHQSVRLKNAENQLESRAHHVISISAKIIKFRM